MERFNICVGRKKKHDLFSLITKNANMLFTPGIQLITIFVRVVNKSSFV